MAGESTRSIAEVLEDIVANVQSIIRSEVQLAKTEITEEATKAGRASTMVIGGAVTGLFALWLLLLAMLFALGIVIPMWAAALVLCALMGVITVVLLSVGKKRFATVHPKPEKTVQTIKENVQWVKTQAK